MADRPLDERYEKLVALLYGELPPAEERAVRGLIERDASLRAAWEEISAARAFLRDAPAAAAETAPSFLFLDEAKPRRRAWRLIPSLAPWAAAAAAVAFAVFAMNDAHRSRLAAERHAASAERRASSAAATAAALSAKLDERPAPVPASIEAGRSQPQPAGDRLYMTRAEFEAYSAGVTQTMTSLLNEYGKQRDSDIASVLQIALSDMADRQARDYRELNGRIENVAQGLADEQFRTSLQVEYLLREEETPAAPARRDGSDQ